MNQTCGVCKRVTYCSSAECSVTGERLCDDCLDEHMAECAECREIAEYHERADYDYDSRKGEGN